MRRRTLLAFLLLPLPLGVPVLEAQSRESAPLPGVAELRVKVDSLQRTRDQLPQAAVALLELARAFQRTAQPDSALATYARARDVAERLPDCAEKAEVLLALGLQTLRVSKYDSALYWIERGRTMRYRLGDTVGASRTWNNTGAAHYQLGNYEQALNAFTESLKGRRLEGDTVGMARVLANIGKVYLDWGQLSRAGERLKESVAMARAGGNRSILGYALHTLAQVYIEMRQFDLAYRTLDESQAEYAMVKGPESGDSTGGWRLNATARGDALVRQGRAREALPLLDSVVALAERNDDVRSMARALTLLGSANMQLGNSGRARELLTRAVNRSRSVEQRVFMLQALEKLSEVEERAGDAPAALRALRAATALRDTIFNSATAARLASEETRELQERQQRENSSLREERRSQAAVIKRQQQMVVLVLLILLLGALLLAQLVRFNRLGKAREATLARTNEELRTALAEVRTLTGLIPICASCKRVRDDRGYWQAVESYISTHSDATFSHAICQSCGPDLYGELWPEQHDPASENPPVAS